MRIFKKLDPSFKEILFKKKFLLLGLCINFAIISFLGVYPIRILGNVINGLTEHKNINFIIKLIILYALIRLCSFLLSVANKFYEEYIKNILSYELRLNSINKLINIKIKEMENIQSTQLTNRIFDVVDQLIDAIINIITWIGQSLMTLVFTIYFLLKIDSITTISFMPVIIIMMFITKYLSKKQKMYYKNAVEKLSYLKDFIQEIFSGVREIKTYNCKEWIIKKYQDKEINYCKSRLKTNFVASLLSGFISLFGLMTISIILFIGAIKSVNNRLNPGDITALILYSGGLFMIIMEIINKYTLFQTLDVSITRFNEILNKSYDEINSIPQKTNSTNNQLFDITIKNINFYYNNFQVLNNINMSIDYGKKIAIVGQSGSGKTTLAKLLLRLYVPHNGSIFIGGNNINEIVEEKLRLIITCCFQNPYFFNDNIYNNICLGEKYPYFEIEKISQASDSYKFIQELEDKFHTGLGERGQKISGGQQQRINLMRGMIRKSNILILDEISSSLDLITESNIATYLKSIKDKTIIIISHKPALLSLVDEIYVLHQGQLIDSGVHEKLLERCEVYKDLIYNSTLEYMNPI